MNPFSFSLEKPFWLFLLVPLLFLLWISQNRRYKKMVVPNVSLWLGTHQKSSRISYDFAFLPLLIPFMLIVLAIISAANPYTIKKVEGYTIVLDNSASMSTEEENGTRWQLACQIVPNYRNKPIKLIVVAPHAHVVDVGTLEKMRVENSAGEPKDAILLARKMLSPHERFVIITDGSGISWNDILVHSEYLENLPEPIVHIVGKNTENLSVRLRDSYFATPQRLVCTLEIQNHGNETQSNTVFAQYQENTSLHTDIQFPFELPAREKFSWQVVISDIRYGGKIRWGLTKPDKLLSDNFVYATVHSMTKSKVLIVDERPNPFLMAVLASYPDIVDVEHSGIVFSDKITWTNAYDLIIMCKKEWKNSLVPGNYLFLGTYLASFPIQYKTQTSNNYCWWTRKKHIITNYVDISSIKIYNAWKCSNIKLENILMSGNHGPLVWQDQDEHIRYIYMAFAPESSEIYLCPSFPIFIHNAIMWASQDTKERLIIDKGIVLEESEIIPLVHTYKNTDNGCIDNGKEKCSIFLKLAFVCSLLLLPFLWLLSCR